MRLARRLGLGKGLPSELRLFWDGPLPGYTWALYQTNKAGNRSYTGQNATSNMIMMNSLGFARTNNHGTPLDSADGEAKDAVLTLDLRKYTTLHFLVAKASGTQYAKMYVNIGDLAHPAKQSPLNGSSSEQTVDISQITDRSNLTVMLYLAAVSAPAYPSHSNETAYSSADFNISRVWATKD